MTELAHQPQPNFDVEGFNEEFPVELDGPRTDSLDDSGFAGVAIRHLGDKETADPSVVSERHGLVAALNEALGTLDERSRDVLLARELEGQTWEDIGKRWGVSPNRAHQIARIAIVDLRKDEGLVLEKYQLDLEDGGIGRNRKVA